MSGLRHGRAAALGLLVDHLAGELPLPRHPVALFGDVMARVERELWRDDRAAGVGHLAVGAVVGAVAGQGVRSAAAATAVTVAGHGLAEAARAVARPLVAGDLDTARARLPSLVGRDPSTLDGQGIARAAVESVAENTVDAVVAPALWGAVGGATGACLYRAINTLDSMVGHHTDRYERYGWASARADDLAGYAPARATALLVAAVRPAAAGKVVRVVWRDAPNHPSPNAGIAEAAFAAALGLELGGRTVYPSRVEYRPRLGEGRPPEAADIERAVSLMHHVTAALAAVLFVTGQGRRRGRRRGRLPDFMEVHG